MLFILICAYSDGQLPNLSLQVHITFAFYEYTSLKLRIKNKNKITIKENYLKSLFLFHDRLDLINANVNVTLLWLSNKLCPMSF